MKTIRERIQEHGGISRVITRPAPDGGWANEVVTMDGRRIQLTPYEEQVLIRDPVPRGFRA